MSRSLAILTLVLLSSQLQADDWPQWMGPKRDNVWRETGLIEKFPEGGAKVVWRVPVAGGYAGPSVADGRVYVADYVTADNVKVDNFDRKASSGIERLLCLDEKTGETLWKHEDPAQYTISYPAGPRTTPVVHQGKVYAQGAEGRLVCLDAKSGDLVWGKDLKKDYKTKAALWGYASQPLIDGEKLIVLAGGEGTHCVALHKDTGKEIWRTGVTAKEQGYSPPIIIQQAGVRQLILTSPSAVYAADPETGKEFWSQPYTADNGSIIMTPIHSGNYLFVAGYNNRNLMLELASDKPGAMTLWRDKAKHALSPINVQPILMDGRIYGMDSDGELRCISVPDGKIEWATPQPLSRRKLGSGTVFLVRQGESDRFWMFAETGDLVIGSLSPEGFTELSRAHILEPTNFAFGREVVWCAPAFANRRAYIRNDKELVCVDIAKAP